MAASRRANRIRGAEVEILVIVRCIALRLRRLPGSLSASHTNQLGPSSHMRQSAPSAAPRRAGRPARSGTREAFVLCSMALVVMALGLGLHLQFNVSGQSALITALVTWMALLVMHLAIRRAHSVAAAATHSAPAAAGEALDQKRPAPPEAPPRRARAATPDEPAARTKPPPLPASALSQQHTSPGPALEPQEELRAAADIRPPRRAPDPPAEQRHLPPEMLAWDLRPGAEQQTSGSSPRPAVFPPLDQAPPPTRKQPAPAAPHFGRIVPGTDDDRARSSTSQPAISLGGANPALDRQAPVPQQPLGAGQPAASATADARATELRSMQNIIDQLARQLRAPADAPPVGQYAAVGTEQAIARSIEALKAAGGAMRAAEASRTEPEAHHGPQSSEATRAPAAAAPSLADAVATGGLEACLDSILSLEDRKTRHFEMTIRVRLGAGEPVAVDDYALMQIGDGLRSRLDAAKLLRVARIAQPLSKRGLSASLFVCLAAESLVDDTFLDTCAAVLRDQPDIVHQLVPSFSQGEIRAFTKPHWETLATLKENGMRFGMERLSDLAMDFVILRERGFQFAKIDAGVLLAGMHAHDGPVSALQVCRRLGEAGLDLIVARIDDDATLTQIGGLGVLYGQGLFFGMPRPVKMDLKGPQEAAA